MLAHYSTIFLLLVLTSDAKPHKDRVIDKDLSDQPHTQNGEHNPEYDHEAFLGKDESKQFDQLSPEESQRRLGIIADKMDADKDGKVSAEELKNWISKASKRYLEDDRNRSWKDMNLDDSSKLTWDMYQQSVFNDPDEDEDDDSMKDILERDKIRWKVADLDGDGVLSKDEYLDFLHPEDAPRMRHIVIDETMADLDKNKDGFIDLEEYIQDMWHKEGDEEEPSWVASERETFAKKRDTNGDGKLDREEVNAWILPTDFDHIDSETKHLMTTADKDNDGFLTKEEILENHAAFVGSQATDFGEGLHYHDEL